MASALFCSTVSGGKAVPRLRGDDDASPAAGDDVAELLQHERRAVQIDFEDRCRRRLRRGDAGGVDQPGDVADTVAVSTSACTGLARGHVDGRDAHLVPGVRQDLRRRVGVLPAQVGQQDVLARADPPRDGLTDLTRSDDDYYVSHSYSFYE